MFLGSVIICSSISSMRGDIAVTRSRKGTARYCLKSSLCSAYQSFELYLLLKYKKSSDLCVNVVIYFQKVQPACL